MSNHKLLFLSFGTVLFLGIIFTLAASAPVAAAGNTTDISSCTTIDQPGTYNIGNDFSVNSIGQTDGCLVVDSSDVVLDGGDHTITGPDNRTGYAIEITNSHFSNITIRNLSAEQWREGIRWHTTQSSLIENFTARNTLRGVGAYNNQGTLIQNSRFINSSGIAGNGNQNITVQNSSFIGANTDTGLDIESTSLVVRDNYFGNISTGVDSPNATIEDNHFVGTNQGIDLSVRENVTIRNNTFEQNWAAITVGGVKTTDPPTRSNDIWIVDNTIRNATGFGLRLSAVQNVTVQDNIITNTTQGIRFGKVFSEGIGIENSTVVNNTIGGPAEWHLQLNGGVNLSTTRFERLYLPNATVTSLNGTGFQIGELDDVPEDPPDSENVGVYVNVSQIGGSANLTVGYNDSVVNESNLTVWRNHNRGWINETANASINIEANTVRMNLTEPSILALMETSQAANEDTTAPTADAGFNQTVENGTTVSFNASGSSDNVGVVAYDWEFGDGSTATGLTPTHTYKSLGTYTTVLTVTDDAGNTATDSVTVTVEDAVSDGDGDSNTGGGGNNGGDANTGGSGGTGDTAIDTEEENETNESSSSTGVRESQADIKIDSETGQAKATFDDESSVESVTIDSDSVEGSIRVIEPSREPESIGRPPGSSVSLMEITVPESAADTPGSVRMRVSRERLESIGAEPKNLRLSRHSDDRWQSLDTAVVEVTDERVVLKAETPGFSYFAVNAVGEPTAKIDAPNQVDAGDELTLDASGSTTDYGKIVAYKWTVGEMSLSGKSVESTASNPGKITIELTVETDKGETDSTTYTILVDDPESGTGDVGSSNTDDAGSSDTGNSSDDSASEDNSGPTVGETPGFGIVTALVSLLAAVLLGIRRQDD